MRFFFDTSVIASLYFEEEGTEYSKDLLKQCYEEGIEVNCSSLINFELGNVLMKNKVKSPTLIMEKFREVFPDQIEYNEELESEAFCLSGNLGLSFYDSCHVGLAMINDGDLITYDKEILKKTKSAITPADAVEKIRELIRVQSEDHCKIK